MAGRGPCPDKHDPGLGSGPGCYSQEEMGSAVKEEVAEDDRSQTELQPHPQGNGKPLENFK